MGERTEPTKEPAGKVHQIELRDLAGLLRRKLGEALELIDQSTEPLLPIGENYCSTILKVLAVIKRKPEAEEEELNLVAKMLPATDFQRLIFDCPNIFRKEAFLYEELIPEYQRLEREFGVEEVFDIVPEFYGTRFSMKEDGDVDDDAVILMRNLKQDGYYTGDRIIGLDLEHACTAIVAIARFHALGIAMKTHKPDYFDVLKIRAKSLELKIIDSGFEEGHEADIRFLTADPEMSVHAERLEAAMRQITLKTWMAVPPEPWGTIIHADFWVNNILFCKGQSGRVENVKFVDFQNYLFLSPLRELTFFITTNLQKDVMDNHFDELLDYYYENFIAVLKRMKCGLEPFRRDKFDERMKIDAFNEFLHCPFMIKAMTAGIKANEKIDDIKDRIMDMPSNLDYLERMRRCVKKFAEKGWLEGGKETE